MHNSKIPQLLVLIRIDPKKVILMFLKMKKPANNSVYGFLVESNTLLWAMRDSNPRPPRCKRGALNQLS